MAHPSTARLTRMATISPLGRNAPLYRNLVRREVRQRYKGSALGLAWTLINPLVLVAAYWVVFRFLFGSPIPNFALFMFVGLMVWTLFYGGLQTASSSLVSNSTLVTKVRFPREIIPLAAISANTVTAGAMLIVVLPLCIGLGTAESLVPLVLLPVFLALAIILTVGGGLLLSGLNVYFRDVEHILNALGTPWFFLTPIFYTYASLPASAQAHGTLINILHYGNPIAPYVIAVQDVLFFGTWPSLGDSIYCVVVAFVVLGVGIVSFRRLEQEMAVEL